MDAGCWVWKAVDALTLGLSTGRSCFTSGAKCWQGSCCNCLQTSQCQLGKLYPGSLGLDQGMQGHNPVIDRSGLRVSETGPLAAPRLSHKPKTCPIFPPPAWVLENPAESQASMTRSLIAWVKCMTFGSSIALWAIEMHKNIPSVFRGLWILPAGSFPCAVTALQELR